VTIRKKDGNIEEMEREEEGRCRMKEFNELFNK
jgi:hypothetical protein